MPTRLDRPHDFLYWGLAMQYQRPRSKCFLVFIIFIVTSLFVLALFNVSDLLRGATDETLLDYEDYLGLTIATT